MSSTPNPHLALADAAEQRANAATKPPWIRDEYDRPNMQVIAHGNEVVCYHQKHNRQIDANVVPNYTFIAHARQDVPALAAAVREQAATIAALQTKLTEASNEAAKWRRIRNNSHGPCCQCQHCGKDYDDCRCDLDEVADELEQAKAKLTEALALVEAGYEEGVADADFNHLCISKANPLWPKTWAASETRAAAERLKGTV